MLCPDTTQNNVIFSLSVGRSVWMLLFQTWRNFRRLREISLLSSKHIVRFRSNPSIGPFCFPTRRVFLTPRLNRDRIKRWWSVFYSGESVSGVQKTCFCPIKRFHLSKKTEPDILVQCKKTNNFRELSYGTKAHFWDTLYDATKNLWFLRKALGNRQDIIGSTKEGLRLRLKPNQQNLASSELAHFAALKTVFMSQLCANFLRSDYYL